MKLNIQFSLILTVIISFAINDSSSQSQKLVVDGGLVLSDVIDASPVAGTVQYNTANQQFQGYNGSQWMNMTSSMQGGEPVTCTEDGIDDSSPNLPAEYFDCTIGGGYSIPSEGVDFVEIPPGKQLHVLHIGVIATQVFITRQDVIEGDDVEYIPVPYIVRIQVERPGISNDRVMYEVRGTVEQSRHITLNTPIMILYPGDRVYAKNLTFNSFTNDVRVVLNGMLYDLN